MNLQPLRFDASLEQHHLPLLHLLILVGSNAALTELPLKMGRKVDRRGRFHVVRSHVGAKCERLVDLQLSEGGPLVRGGGVCVCACVCVWGEPLVKGGPL